jgi:SHS2 domain-containing protein
MEFKFLDHTADIKFQAFGNSLNEVFENSALALINSIFSGDVKPVKKKKIKVKGKDLESLMYNFLEEFLFLIDAKKFIPSKVKVIIDEEGKKLEAELSGDSVGNYQIDTGVKAITYHDMFIQRIGKRWIAQVVLDV